MSSCQDSMDTEDSIPRPEYEDIVPSEEVEDDDEEFWVEKPKAKTLGIEQGTKVHEATSSQLAVTSDPASLAAGSSNCNQTVVVSNKDPVDIDDNEEISYDEADEEDEDEVEEELRKRLDKLVSNANQVVQNKDDPLTIPVVTSNASTTSASTASAAAQTESRNNKLVLVTLINENGKLIVPLATKPVIGATVVKRSPPVSPEEEKMSPMDEMKSSQLTTPKEDPPRSTTPSRGNREFMALQRSFTESKVLSEFVNEKDRARKSRKLPLKSEDSNVGDSGEKEKFRICRARSKSCTRTISRPVTILNSSAPQKWPSDEKLNSKRENMRSQNTDFVQKQMKFLNRVNHEQLGDDPLTDASDGEQSLNESNKTVGSVENKDDCWQPPPKRGADSFCWKCRKCADLIPCSKCPRSYHYKCIKVGTTTRLDKTWVCPECVVLDSCINGSKKTKKESLSVDVLNQLLQFALKRMKQIKGYEKLLDVPDDKACPLYARYVVNPVTLNSIQKRIENNAYRCTEEFVLDTKWIQHNVSIAFAAYSSKYVFAVAKNLLKVCRQEAAEIETCSECYLNANTRKDWFVDVCLKPHILLWAKLKGFPYWPAKGMGLGPNSLVNVRFFGDHDRAFVPVKDCFLYSQADPNPPSGKRPFRPGIADCIKEVDVHIQKIKAKVGAFNYAPLKTHYDPINEAAQLEEMMPGVTEYLKRQVAVQKPPLTYKIVKTAGNNLSIIKKPDSGTDSDHSSLGGAEKIQKTIRPSTEISKPSPLSEAKKVKESHTVTQSTPPKPTTTNKCIPNKTLSLNYEVVTKPVNKDETNSTKITSVILKRKSEVVLLSPSVKKSKSSEDSPVKEYIQNNKSPKQEAKLEETKESTEAVPAKRTRSSCSGENTIVQNPILSASYVLFRSTPNETHQSQQQQQTPQQQQKSQQQLNPQQLHKPQQHSQKQQSQQKPQQSQSPQQEQKQQQPQKADVATTSSVNKDAIETSNAMVKLVQNRQGVTIKKITKKQSGGTTTDDKTNPALERYPQTKYPPLQGNAIPLPAPPPKPVVSPPKRVQSPPRPGSISSATKSKSSHPCTKIHSSPKHIRSSSAADKSNNSQGFIAFEDIKLERSEDEELILTKSTPSTSKAVDPLATPSTSSTPNSSLLQASGATANGNSKTPHSGVTPPSLPVNPDLVKKETISDDDLSLNSTPSQENSSPVVVVNPQPINRPPEPPRLVGETMIQRIVVRSIESLTMQPPPLKSAPSYYFTSLATSVQSPTPPVTSSPAQSKKPNARARKSFPNKGPNSTTAVLPPDVKRSLTKNSMVYIPIDSQNNAVPIQPLTAVSKPVNHNQAMVKVTCATVMSTSSSSQNSLNPVSTTSSLTLPTSTAIPLPAPPPPPPPITVSAALTNSTTPVSSTITAVTSLEANRPSYAPSLNTLSPLQLTVPTTPTTEAEQINESNRVGEHTDGHILSGIVTPSLAAAITDSIFCGPPKLAQRPNGALRSDGSYGFNSEAGPVSRTLMENAHKMTDFFMSVIQDTVSDIANSDVLQAKIVELQLELETRSASYEKRLEDLKNNTDAMLCQMKKSLETERMRIVSETRKQCEIERIHAVEQTKKRQWCANCGREANCYCCWNTAYCDTTCQGIDWMRHKPNCCQVNPHLNPELQGPGILYSAPTLVSTSSTITTASSQMTNCSTPGFMPLQSVHLYRASQPAPTQLPASPAISLSSQTSTTATTQSKGGVLPYTPTTCAPYTGASLTGSPYTGAPPICAPYSGAPPICAPYSSAPLTGVPSSCAPSTLDLAYRSKEVLKLPPSTYLRALPPTMRLPAQPVHRFNIPLPLAAAATTGGPPYTLVHREGSWELMGTSHPTSTVATTVSSLQQPPRLMNSVTANLPPGSRALGPVMVRPNQM